MKFKIFVNNTKKVNNKFKGNIKQKYKKFVNKLSKAMKNHQGR